MQKAKRGFGSGRIVGIALWGSLALALAGCGAGDSGSSGTATTASTTGSTTSQTAATNTSTSGSTATTSGGSTTGGSTTAGSATGGSTTTTTTPPAASASTGVTLGWVAPTQNSNGTPITDLAGYKIHYGTMSQDYTQEVAIKNPSLSRYVVDSLPSGTYYFAITAYNSKGIESALSGEISAKLN
jgi:hypothetical protein